ncbi:hypothetical protein OJAV_G00116740 [Oryzias javanicus]|uniref:Golgin subfamily A member 6-like protein 22 n=1 Tax=Oryzias javanicus TaxID=123683 RepID=A0A437CRF6_ORYJA|nr:hypothetical protein OJAV_G00116740 [Oryzias javanicus]
MCYDVKIAKEGSRPTRSRQVRKTPGVRMLSNKEDKRTFSNGALRDKWEKRTQNIAEQCKQEAEWKEKSSLKVLFSKWTYHLSLVQPGDQMKSDTSEFRRVTSRADESASPKLRRPKRKVEVDVFGLCWKESWMSLKPPKYLYLKAKESKPVISGFTAIQLTSSRKYKAQHAALDDEPTCVLKWSQSWKQVRSPAQEEVSEEREFKWDTVFERLLLHKANVEKYSLPPWAGTWKFINFPFRQEKKKWDCAWPVYHEPNCSNKLTELEMIQQQKEQNEPFELVGSWKLNRTELFTEDPTDDEDASSPSIHSEAVTTIQDVHMPGWSRSWQLSAAPPQEYEERLKSWSSCWSYSQQMRWCQASINSHHQHSVMLTRKREATNFLLTAKLQEETSDSTEWSEAWKTPKVWAQLQQEEEEEEEEEAEEEEVDKAEIDEEEVEEEEEEEDEGVEDEEEEVNENEQDQREIDEENFAIVEKDVEKEDEDEGVDAEEEEEEEEEEKEEERANIEEDDDDEEEEDPSGDENVKETDCEDKDEEKHKDFYKTIEDDVEREDKDEGVEAEEDEEEKEGEGNENVEEDDDIEEEERDNQEEPGEKVNKNRNVSKIDDDEGEEEKDTEERKEEEENDEEEENENEEEVEENEEEVEENEEELDKDNEKEVVKDLKENEDADGEEEVDEDNEEEVGEGDMGEENKVEEVDEDDEEIDEDDEEIDEDDKGEVVENNKEDIKKDEEIGKVITEEVDEDEEEEPDEEEEGNIDEDEEEVDEEEEVEEEEVDEDNEKNEGGRCKARMQEGPMKNNEKDETLDINEEEKTDEDQSVRNTIEGKKNKKLPRRVKARPDVPLHLQFHKLNASFASWKQSWMVAVPHRGGQESEEEEAEGEDEAEWRTWRESWRICRRKKSDEDEVLCFSMKHRSQRCTRLEKEESWMPEKEWNVSWKMVQTSPKREDPEEDDEEEDEEEEEEEEEEG